MEVSKVLKMFSLAYCANSVHEDLWWKTAINQPFSFWTTTLKISYEDEDCEEI